LAAHVLLLFLDFWALPWASRNVLEIMVMDHGALSISPSSGLLSMFLSSI